VLSIYLIGGGPCIIYCCMEYW